MARFTKLFSVIFVVLAIYFARPLTNIHAQGWVGQGYGEALDQSKTNDAINSDSYITDVLYDNMMGVGCSIVPTGGANGCTNDPTILDQMNEQSAVGQISALASNIYSSPPASSIAFVKDLGYTLGFMSKPVYAQSGIGFSGLSSLLPLWKAFRNIAYALIAIVLIFIGFMVMFRKKIDPKTVVTVQNALPRIVITLLLVTFSYAIAGLLIDLMYFIMFLILNIIVAASQGMGGGLGADTVEKYTNGGLWTLWWSMFWGGSSAVDDIIRLITPWNGFGLSAIAQIGETVTIGPIIFLIVAIAILFGYIRLVFSLASAYIQIIIAVILGPLQLIFEAVPGGNSFSSWISNLIANLAIFPVTAAMLALGTIITRLDPAFPAFQGGTALWTPPLLSGGGGTSGIAGIIGLGFLLAAPTVAGQIKEALKTKAAVNVGPGAVLGPMGAGVGQVFQLGYQASFLKSAWTHGPEKPSTPVGRQSTAARSEVGGVVAQATGASDNH